jgi:hypothetical protein
METPHTEVAGPVRPARRARPRISWERYSQDHARANPALYRAYDVPAIVNDMIANAGVPRSVLEDLLSQRLRLDRRKLDPDPGYKPRQPSSSRSAQAVAARAAETVALEQKVSRRLLHTITADFIMSDDRRLGDWTISQLRKLNGAFAFIIKAAGTEDDSRTVDQVMTPRLWKRVGASNGKNSAAV